MHDHQRKALARNARTQVACAACALRDFCVAHDASPGGEAAGIACRRLKSGEVLFAAGHRQRGLYAVRAGLLKECAVTPSGERPILSLHIMGDVVGLDALASGSHPTHAVALKDSELCELPLERAEMLIHGGEATALRLRTLLSEQLAMAQERMVTLGWLTARQRVARFLLDLARRWACRGYSSCEFDLGLRRKEIGSYLGLTCETVSRTLSAFSRNQWIELQGRRVLILDRGALEAQLARKAPD